MTAMRESGRIAWWMAGLLVIPLACADPAADLDRAPHLRGLRIVTNPWPAWNERDAWTVDPVPAVRIGALDGPTHETFARIGSVSQTDDGNIVVADAGRGKSPRFVHVYREDGSHLATWGGAQGRGPGELWEAHYARAVGGDTVLVSDSTMTWQTWFTVRDGYIRDRRTAIDATRHLVPPHERFVALTALPGNGYLMKLQGAALVESRLKWTIGRDTVRYVWLDDDLAVVRDLGARPGDERLSLWVNRQSSSVPLLHSAKLAVGWDPTGARLCAGDTMEPIVICHDRDGSTTAFELRRDPIAIERHEWNDWLDQRRRFLDMIEVPAAVRDSLIAAIDMKSYRPVYSRLFVDDEMNVWVDVPRPRPDVAIGDTYSVHDRGGRYLGDVTMPAGLTVHEIRGDRVLGAIPGPVDVPLVWVHSIRRSPH